MSSLSVDGVDGVEVVSRWCRLTPVSTVSTVSRVCRECVEKVSRVSSRGSKKYRCAGKGAILLSLACGSLDPCLLQNTSNCAQLLGARPLVALLDDRGGGSRSEMADSPARHARCASSPSHRERAQDHLPRAPGPGRALTHPNFLVCAACKARMPK